MTDDIVFLLDVDNTLLDADQLVADFRRYIEREIGAAAAARYWAIFEQMRSELGYVDYLGAVQRYRLEIELRSDAPSANAQLDPQKLTLITQFLLDYPFAERLYDRAFEVIRHLGRFGKCVILTDGDIVLQPHKIRRTGLWDAVGGRVLIYVHKEKRLDAVERRYPARHYVLVDDKPRILAAVKPHWHSRVTTVLPLQGHYALDAMRLASFPTPDLIINEIGALMDIKFPAVFEKIPEAIDQTA